jgi:uncharacterized membrane protein
MSDWEVFDLQRQIHEHASRIVRWRQLGMGLEHALRVFGVGCMVVLVGVIALWLAVHF